jgi:hypothetical protein
MTDMTEKQEYHRLMVYIFNHDVTAVQKYIAEGKNINFYSVNQNGTFKEYDEDNPILVNYDPWINLHQTACVTSFLDDLNHQEPSHLPSLLSEFTPLSYACFLGFEDIARALIGGGADINIDAAAHISRVSPMVGFEIGRNYYQWTDVPAPFEVSSNFQPLWWACKNRQNDLARLLISKGANIHMVYELDSFDGFLQFACECGNVELVEYLLRNGQKIQDYPDLLLSACYYYHLDMVQLLLSYGVNPKTEPFVSRHGREHGCLATMERSYLVKNMRKGAFIHHLDLDAVYCYNERCVLDNYDIEATLQRDEKGLATLAAMILAGEELDHLRCSVVRGWVEPMVRVFEQNRARQQTARLEMELLAVAMNPSRIVQFADNDMKESWNIDRVKVTV